MSSKEYPAFVGAYAVFNVIIEISNSSSYVLNGSSPHPVNIAYNWLDEEGSATIVFDGKRTPLIPILSPGSKEFYEGNIRAPVERGRYTLRMTLVQEAVRWFDQAATPLAADVSIVVNRNDDHGSEEPIRGGEE